MCTCLHARARALRVCECRLGHTGMLSVCARACTCACMHTVYGALASDVCKMSSRMYSSSMPGGRPACASGCARAHTMSSFSQLPFVLMWRKLPLRPSVAHRLSHGSFLPPRLSQSRPLCVACVPRVQHLLHCLSVSTCEGEGEGVGVGQGEERKERRGSREVRVRVRVKGEGEGEG